MKRIFIFISLVLLLQITLSAQVDQRLKERLDSTLMATKAMDFERVMDFTYPKLFTIVPREQLLNMMKEAFQANEFQISLDSLEIIRINPVFTTEEGQFSLIRHKMTMFMKINPAELEGDSTESRHMIAEMIKMQFGDDNVVYEKETQTLKIKILADMVAVKDNYAPEWCFVNFKNDDELSSLLFSKSVLDKLKEFL